MSTSSSRVAEVIKRLRKEANLTQAELAEALGITAVSVHRYESGTSTPRRSVFRGLAELASRLSPELDSEIKVLLGLWDLRNRLVHMHPEDNRPLTFPAEPSQPHRRSVLDVHVLAALSQLEREILEAVLELLGSDDTTAKRMLATLVQPWLSGEKSERIDPTVAKTTK